MNKVNVFVVSFFLAAAVFLISGATALAVDVFSIAPTLTGFVSSADLHGQGDGCRAWLYLDSICGVNHEQQYSDNGNTGGSMVGTICTVSWEPDRQALTPNNPYSASIEYFDVPLNTWVMSSCQSFNTLGGPPPPLTPAEQSTAAIQASGETVAGMFFAQITSVILIVVALIAVLWGIRWIRGGI